jgi:hypothetical protein
VIRTRVAGFYGLAFIAALSLLGCGGGSAPPPPPSAGLQHRCLSFICFHSSWRHNLTCSSFHHSAEWIQRYRDRKSRWPAEPARLPPKAPCLRIS